MANQFASPNITVKEIDLSGVVPAVDTSTGAFVGDFNWGPVEQPVLVSNEARLAETFGSPVLSTKSSVDFLTAAYFLKYATTLYVARAQQGALNAALVGTGTVTSITISGTNNNYTTTPSLTVVGDGSGATATATMEIKSIAVGDDGGTGYAIDDTFQIDLGTGNNAVAKVTDTGLGGVVTGVALLSGGSFTGTLTAINEAATTNTNGTGDGDLTVDVTVGIKSITMTDIGTGYTTVSSITQTPTGNATLTGNVSTTGTLVKNGEDWEYKKSALADEQLIAKYPGSVGNSLLVSICPALGGGFSAWAYKDEFDAAPGSSAYVSTAQSGATTNDEVHIAVVDEDGVISGTPGVVLETFSFVSLASDAKTTDGTSNYLLDVLNAKSAYVWAADVAAFSELGQSSASFTAATASVQNSSLTGGLDSATLDEGDYSGVFEGHFADPENITVDYLIAPGMTTRPAQTTVVNNLSGIASAQRKDCVVLSSPSRDDVLNQSSTTNIANAVEAFSNGVTASNYLILDNNWLKVYDKYKDAYTFIPASSSTAGLLALTDQVAAPWFSPAGQRRGLYFGVTSLAWNAAREYRDQLYKAGVNPIVNLPGQGILLYGDKTKESRPSAFDRINVRRLFLTIERAIKQASENVLFEFNDEFTRSEFVGIVEPFLREIQGRRGITDFRVVCDETNNTAAVIDSNRFVASIFIKPARSINFVTLNFVAVRTGVEFDEVVGVV
jgi:phage tail sheath protein FI